MNLTLYGVIYMPYIDIGNKGMYTNSKYNWKEISQHNVESYLRFMERFLVETVSISTYVFVKVIRYG